MGPRDDGRLASVRSCKRRYLLLCLLLNVIPTTAFSLDTGLIDKSEASPFPP